MGARRRHGGAERGGLRSRAFGTSAADLDIDVRGAGRTRSVTDVLAACVCTDDGEPLDRLTLARWTLGQRLEALITVGRAGGTSRVGIRVVCPLCGSGMELDIDVSDIVVSPAGSQLAWRSDEGEEIIVRLPRGEDQERWSANGTTDPADVAGSLVIAINDVAPPPGFRVPPEWMSGLDAAAAAHDPLTALSVTAECPDCCTASEYDVDLEGVLLREIQREQHELLDDVCRLATAFHWSETDILALPRWRRQQYLARLDAGSFR